MNYEFKTKPGEKYNPAQANAYAAMVANTLVEQAKALTLLCDRCSHPFQTYKLTRNPLCPPCLKGETDAAQNRARGSRTKT